ncbi:hypothetical protein LJC38_01575 [Parabacteroides sp. OttesenSCG-928-K15]|nr:hypothetical protein [Parabacteroides sp. OttesenSCG-928-K15]
MKPINNTQRKRASRRPAWSGIGFLILFASLFFVFGCSEEQPYTGGEPGNEYLAPGEALLRVAIDNGKKGGTYAAADFAADPAEKEIKSIALFTKTDDVGTVGQATFLSGAFNKFFSTEEIGDPWSLYEPLTDIGDGKYTVSIKVKSEGFGPKTKVLAIANYAENGLTETLKKVTRWEDLANLMTPAANNHLETPLLMVGMPATDVDLAEKDTKAPEIRLTRVAARIDVVNLGHDPLDATKGFRLESAQIFQPREYSYILPGNEFQSRIPVVGSYKEILSANPPHNDPAKITGLYLYETDNLGADNLKTYIRIKGKLFGKPFTRDVPLKKKDESEVKIGEPIPLARNHRYVLNIQPPIEQGPVEWDFNVIDWSDGTMVSIDPTIDKPVIATPNLSQATAANWNASKKIYTFADKVETVKFTVSSLRTPILDIKFEHGDPEMVGLGDPASQAYKDFFRKSTIITYAKVEQTFEISTPQFIDPTNKTPIHFKLCFYDPTDKYYKDSISFQYIPKYADTNYYPVKVGGYYWAPVNVGATTTMGASSANTASTGYYYQWGRNIPFDATKTYSTISSSSTNYLKATEGVDKDKFIVNNGDWLNSSDPNYNLRNSLWTKDVNKSPCPKGWRVPTKEELKKLITAANTWDAAENRYKITSDESGQFLYISRSGFLNRENSVISSYNSRTDLWSSDTDSGVYTSILTDNSWRISTANRASGIPIRCILDY